MNKHVRNIIKCVLFVGILVFSLLGINELLIPKYTLKNNTWPTTSTYHGFYKMKKDTVDVLLMGSSTTVNALNPQEIYNEYGIRSYNLGSEQQSVFLSYYWLKEALRYQSPKVVVFDTRFMWNVHPEYPINTSEGLTRKCIDPMKFSSVKREAVRDICSRDDTQSELSYYLTNLRFHSRWSSLKKADLDLSMTYTSELKGYGPVYGDGPEEYTPIEPEDDGAWMEFNPLMQEYLDKIVDLCKTEGIQLVLISLPGNEMDNAAHHVYTAYAEEHGIDYYNLCSKEYYDQIGAVLPKENVVGHENVQGAAKTSRFIGKLLRDKYYVPSVNDEQYESTRAFYEQIKENAEIGIADEQAEYLRALKPDHYAVFMASRGDCASALTAEAVQELKNFGIQDIPDSRKAFFALMVQNKIEAEGSAEGGARSTGKFSERNVRYQLESNPQECVIEIEDKQYAREEDGLNIVVYDLLTGKVIDKVTFQKGNVLR